VLLTVITLPTIILLGYFISFRATTFSHIVPIIALAVHAFQRDFQHVSVEQCLTRFGWWCVKLILNVRWGWNLKL